MMETFSSIPNPHLIFLFHKTPENQLVPQVSFIIAFEILRISHLCPVTMIVEKITLAKIFWPPENATIMRIHNTDTSSETSVRLTKI